MGDRAVSPLVVVDLNVLVSAAISKEGIPRRILGTWHAGFFAMLVSYDLLYELEAVLLRPYFRDKLTYSDVLAYVSWIRDSAELYESYAYQVPRRKGEERVSADPDDDYLYYLALDTMADYLVSGDSHLLQISSRLVYVVVELGKLRLIHALTAVTSFAQAPSLRRVTTDWLYSIFEARGCLDAY